jgi:DNA invertase Pin-like site-specific DNA recombinase
MTMRPVTRSRDRTTVARPPDANLTGPLRARRPDTVLEIQRLAGGGASMALIAEQFGVSKRTVYRYLERGLEYFDVELDGWSATFAVCDRRPPWRVSQWQRTAP